MVAVETGKVPVRGPVHVWEGKMEGSQGKVEHAAATASAPAFVPSFPWLKKDVEPAKADGIPYDEPEGWGLS